MRKLSPLAIAGLAFFLVLGFLVVRKLLRKNDSQGNDAPARKSDPSKSVERNSAR